jgi:hypothetical protein
LGLRARAGSERGTLSCNRGSSSALAGLVGAVLRLAHTQHFLLAAQAIGLSFELNSEGI